MPRPSGGGGSGFGGLGRIRLPGVYARLRQAEERLHRYPVVEIEPGNPAAGHFRRPADLVNALRNGETVTVRRSSVEVLYWEGRGSGPAVPWPAEVAVMLTVTPDDVVTPAH